MNEAGTGYSILLAEDDTALRGLMEDILLGEGHEVIAVPDGAEALEWLQKRAFNLLISDINMPRMGGFELFSRLESMHPTMQRILITAYNIDEYMDLITTHNIGNIIVKQVPFDIADLCLLVRLLLTRDIFGLERHLLPGTPVSFQLIRRPQEIEDLSHRLALEYGDESNFRKLRTVLVELLTNAVFYGARNEQGEDKSTWHTDFELPEDQAIEVHHARDGEKIGFGIVDKGGRLDKKTILYWLNRQITPSQGGLPEGIFDSHGRGIFITRKCVDRLLIHVDPGHKCECLILNYLKPLPMSGKPLRIIEL